MTSDLDKVNEYDPKKIYNIEFNEGELKSLEKALEGYMHYYKQDMPQHVQDIQEDFLLDEEKLLHKLYEVSDQILEDYHDGVDNQILHESLNQRWKKIREN